MLGRLVPSLSLPRPKIKDNPTLVVHFYISATWEQRRRPSGENGKKGVLGIGGKVRPGACEEGGRSIRTPVHHRASVPVLLVQTQSFGLVEGRGK